MSDDAVLVEHPDRDEEQLDKEEITNVEDIGGEEPTGGDGVVIPKEVGAYQIVSIGSEEDKYSFTFHEEKLNAIMSKIPAGWKVSVVSVVGAFRTGKSFVLSWFLQYLHYTNKKDLSPNAKWFEEVEFLGNEGFNWRGGSERNTTGIWIWSEPQFFQKESGEQIAVLLVDTQGMFDNETTMGLTASIFGLSTLLSSYQIYNVDKRIQEDNLQQLALFSEYARMAMTSHGTDESEPIGKNNRPFQQIEFLVRDWQNFEEEEDFEKMQEEMEEYLQKVIAEREATDLKETREQIVSCFEKITCYGLVHPGPAVTKKKYAGDIKSVDPTFVELLDRYCRRIFNPETLVPKIIHGRELTSVELSSYFKAYADLFTTGATFPEAGTLLNATAQANNTNAVTLSLEDYKQKMNRIAGPNCSNYVRPEELKELHREVMGKSMSTFKSIANFGGQRHIEEAREKLLHEVDETFLVYTKLNESRNPLAGFETYILPIAIALVAYVLRVIADTTCSGWSTVCRKSSDFLSHLYAVVVCFLLIIGMTKAQQIKDLFNRLKGAIKLIIDGGKDKTD
mmetsp:Transcript_13041/g.19909  ORF Transcript_13041/g.19909 Transcript_13041/m.19909 type:complete len:564 (+) Transcript_13041:131-1822(+)